jgi:micrococcal nuclease
MTYAEANEHIRQAADRYVPSHTPAHIRTYQYWAQIDRVVDADTVDLRISLGFQVETNQRFRLLGVNAPEIFGVPHASAEYIAGLRAHHYLQDLLPKGSWVEVTVYRGDREKYGRWLCEIFFNQDSINALLLANGYAIPA